MAAPLIRYNLKDRGRQHTGQPRNFNIRAIMDAVNSPECQERVASRDMLGYFGHWPRVRFGMDATEGGISGGKVHAVEPAVVTTHLRAFDDGTIEHRTEFLDTAAGRIAARMFDSKVGGFSSAIDQMKPRFVAFDYVANPNFVGNSYRGVVLDDAINGSLGELTYDDVYAAEQAEQAQAIITLLDSANAERERANEVIERLSAENEQLLSMLARKGIEPSAVLDAAFVLPIAVSTGAADRIRRDAALFRSVPLPRFVEPQAEEPENNSLYDRLLGRFTR
jgi:hypothetical protein